MEAANRNPRATAVSKLQIDVSPSVRPRAQVMCACRNVAVQTLARLKQQFEMALRQDHQFQTLFAATRILLVGAY